MLVDEGGGSRQTPAELEAELERVLGLAEGVSKEIDALDGTRQLLSYGVFLVASVTGTTVGFASGSTLEWPVRLALAALAMVAVAAWPSFRVGRVTKKLAATRALANELLLLVDQLAGVLRSEGHLGPYEQALLKLRVARLSFEPEPRRKAEPDV